MQDVTFRFYDDPRRITSQLQGLRSEPVLALDLEADSLHSYREKVCLVQVSTTSTNAIFDPLSERTVLEHLGPILADPTVEKVLHGGDYDVRLLKKDSRFEVRNLFDTMIAAQFTGRVRFGLAALLEEHFGVCLDKKHQRADWSARPLSRELLSYAALDTAYLLPLRARLEQELRVLGRLEWAREEFRLLESVTPTPTKAPSCFDVKGSRRLAPRQLAVLQSLLEVRDRAARQRDRPPFKILPNAVLLRWAQTPPRSKRDLLEASGASKRLLSHLADAILGAVRKAEGLPPEACPRPSSTSPVLLTPRQEKLLRRLKRVRSEAGERLGMAPGMLVNTATLERIVRGRRGGEENLEGFLKNWQLEAIGDALRRELLS